MTTLHEAIERVLNRKGVPMAPWEIERELAVSDEYFKKDLTRPKVQQIVLRIRKYPHLFQVVNGYVINVKDEELIILVKSVNRIKILLSDIFSFENVQLIIASLLFYKRLVDIKTISDSNSDSFFHFEFFRRFEFIGLQSFDIFYELENQLRRVDKSILHEVYNSLRNIVTVQYEEERFSSIFEFIIYNLSAEKPNFRNSSPEFIRYLLPKLVDNKTVQNILDPTAGMGGILTSILKDYSSAEIFGTEINIQSALIGNLNLYLHGCKEEPIQTTSFLNVQSKRFDVIVGDFPISGVSYKKPLFISPQFPFFESSGRGFASLVAQSYELLSFNGKAVITVADSFLTKRGLEENVRRFLVQGNIVETIISLPSGAYRPYSDIKMSILILNKNKPDYLRNKVRFIRGTSIESSKNGIVLDVEKVIEEYHFFRENTTTQNILDIVDLDEDFNLTAERNSPQYLLKKTMLKDGTAFSLDSIADIQRGLSKSSLSDIYNNLPYIKIEDLDEDILNVELKLKNEIDLSSFDLTNVPKLVISQPSILMSIVGKKMKTNIFLPTSQVPFIVTSSSIIAISPRNDDWNLEYLYFQLNSSFVKDQINSLKKGNTIVYLTLKDIKKILVPYSELSVQKGKIDQQRSEIIFRHETNGNIQLTKEEIDKEKEQTELNLVRTITHQLKHMLMNVYIQVEKIKRISDANALGRKKEYPENSPILEQMEGFEAPENLTLDEVLSNARSGTKLLNQILEDVKKAIHLELEFNNHSIKGIIEEIAKSYPKLNISINGEDAELTLSKSHITDVLQTLINNSIQHSFGEKNEGNIEFNFKSSSDKFTIDYITNGLPIKITEQEYKSIATKSTTSNGTGMGGYYIDKVIQAHNGKLRIKEKLKKGVKIEIELPLLNDYD